MLLKEKSLLKTMAIVKYFTDRAYNVSIALINDMYNITIEEIN